MEDDSEDEEVRAWGPLKYGDDDGDGDGEGPPA